MDKTYPAFFGSYDERTTVRTTKRSNACEALFVPRQSYATLSTRMESRSQVTERW